MEIQAQTLVNVLTAQRNRAFDEAAQLAAMVTQLQETVAKHETTIDGLRKNIAELVSRAADAS